MTEKPEGRAETSDGRFVEIEPGVWWDTHGVDLVDQITLEAYLDDHPDVGIILKRPISTVLN